MTNSSPFYEKTLEFEPATRPKRLSVQALPFVNRRSISVLTRSRLGDVTRLSGIGGEQRKGHRMQIDVNGTRLWFDVDGPALVPDGPRMGERPTAILVHGGPGSYDHSYFRPYFAHLAGEAQVVYLDLRDHGRSARHDPADWGFELCADDLRAFCDAIGIVRPVVLGHSMGGFIAMLYGARHPGHAGALILQSTFARFDLTRLVEGFRRVAGDEIAELARRDYGGDPVNDEEWTRIFAAFGPKSRARRSWHAGSETLSWVGPGWSYCAGWTSSTNWLASPARRWSAWASSTLSPRWLPRARSSRRCRLGPGSSK